MFGVLYKFNSKKIIKLAEIAMYFGLHEQQFLLPAGSRGLLRLTC